VCTAFVNTHVLTHLGLVENEKKNMVVLRPGGQFFSILSFFSFFCGPAVSYNSTSPRGLTGV
jgi:hypothetical protein